MKEVYDDQYSEGVKDANEWLEDQMCKINDMKETSLKVYHKRLELVTEDAIYRHKERQVTIDD